MNKANECTCPSGDGSLVHPCPAHPAVEQAGGDERAAFEAWATHLPMDRQPLRPDLYMPQTQWAWEAWQFRAALAQPSPAQAEAERPEVVAYRTIGRHTKHQHPHYALNYYKQNAEDQAAHWRERGCEVSEDELMTVSQHERIVGELRADRDSWAKRWDEAVRYGARIEEQRDAALARVASLESKLAELEKQEPVAYVLFRDGEVYYETDDNIVISNTPGDETDLYRWLPVFTAPVAQAQQLHDLDKQCRDDVARALGLRPNQERGFAWSYLLASIKSCVKASEDSAQAQHSVPGDIMRDAQRYRWLRDQQFYFSFSTENSDAGISSCTAGMSSRFKNLSWVDAAIDSAIAGAPGKEGV